MSELNSGKIKITNDGNIIMQFSNYHHVIDSDTELYYKHQADKVITELKGQVNGFKNRSNLWYYNAVEEHKKFVQVDQQITELKAQKAQAEDDCAYWKTMAKQRAEALKRERRQKYKRCLVMTEMCEARYDEEDAKVNGYGASWEYISKEMKYWERWRQRWLELAEKFKEAK